MAHKTGTITRIHHDAAIVYGPRPYVLVLLVRGIQDEKQSAALMAELSRPYSKRFVELCPSQFNTHLNERSCPRSVIRARRAAGAPAGAERGEGAPASDGDGGSGGAKPPGQD